VTKAVKVREAIEPVAASEFTSFGGQLVIPRTVSQEDSGRIGGDGACDWEWDGVRCSVSVLNYVGSELACVKFTSERLTPASLGQSL
jgi:ATP-dependent DNA ligase